MTMIYGCTFLYSQFCGKRQENITLRLFSLSITLLIFLWSGALFLLVGCSHDVTSVLLISYARASICRRPRSLSQLIQIA